MYGTTAKLKVIKVMECRIWKASQRLRVLTQSCLTLCDPLDGSPPDSSVHGIFQARIL